MPDIPPPAHVRPLWLRFALYQAVLHLALPLLLGLMALRTRKEPLAIRHFAHRLGFGPKAGRGAVWIFAASLGEVRAASPLIDALRARGHRICLTVTSPAGLIEARRLYADRAGIATGYAPLDLAWTLGIFLMRQRPAAYLAVESEIWPGKLMLTALAGIPRAQVNGNLVERSLTRRILGLPNPILPFLTAYDLVLTKSEAHRDRYIRTGVDPARIALPGELKFDLALPPGQRETGAALKADWAENRPVFLIASSVSGEEPALLALTAALMALPRPPRILWAPRSPQRFDAVAAALTAAGHRLQRRTQTPDLRQVSADILLGDSLGEMTIWYEAADLVFVGASLVDHGGHNIVEPLAQGRPVVMGPSTWGIAFPAEDAQAAGVLIPARDAEALTRTVTRLLADPAAVSKLSARAASFSTAHLGAARRSADILAPLLPDPAVQI